jgi:hypothetical protein
MGRFATCGAGTDSIGQAIVPGFRENTFGPNDDGSYPCTGKEGGTPGDCTPAAIPLPFPVDFYGSPYQSLYINNNGNLTFGAPLSVYTPESLNQIGVPMIAPFRADVDTRVGQLVTFGYQSVVRVMVAPRYAGTADFAASASAAKVLKVAKVAKSAQAMSIPAAVPAFVNALLAGLRSW